MKFWLTILLAGLSVAAVMLLTVPDLRSERFAYILIGACLIGAVQLYGRQLPDQE